MTIDERDYMRSDGGRPLKFPELVRRPWWRRIKWRTALPTALLFIGVASAALWLFRDAWSVLGPSPPAKGSLVVNINTATIEELITIPGVAEARARQIIAFRPYSSVDELNRIPGVSGRTLEGIRPFVTVQGETEQISR